MGSNELDIVNIILSSGPVVKGVLLLLFFASIVSWAIIFKKRKNLKKIEKDNAEFLDAYYSCKDLRDVKLKTEHLPNSPFKIMFLEGFSELESLRSKYGLEIKSHIKDFGIDSLERALKKGANEANLKMGTLVPTLASIGSVTPFVGLFGTVWGIINSFTGLASGGATLDAVAPGIAEALVATAVGLFAAIPAVWFFNRFSGETNKINIKMESFGEGFLNNVERSLDE
jgi:biopolymer transport protein TolQ